MNANLYTLLHSRSAATADRVFLHVPGGRSVTYAQVHEASARMATVLIDAGVGLGDRVVVQVPKSPDAVALYLACLRAGAVYVPLNPAYVEAEVDFFVEDAGPALFVHDDGLAAPGTAPATTMTRLTADSATADPTTTIAPRLAGDLAAMLYTSGTTGRSKGAMLTHANLTSNALTLHDIWGFEEGDVLLHILPIFHVHGLFVALHTAMLNVSTIIFLDRFDVEQVVEQLGSATVMMGVPTHYARLLDDLRLDAERCRGMRLFTSGSAPMTAELHRAFEERTGHRILERYGMTEAGMITSNPYDGERLPGTVGFALPGVSVRVCDDDGEQLPPGETGVVEVHGPNLFAGYWRLPERTLEEHRPDGYFVTGDVGRLDDDGRLTLEGRRSDMIISGGLNIYPREIEAALDAIDGVVEAAVIGVPDSDLGEAVVAIVVGSESTSPETISAALAGRLAHFKHPKAVICVDSLPRNAMGKVQKSLLRRAHADALSR